MTIKQLAEEWLKSENIVYAGYSTKDSYVMRFITEFASHLDSKYELVEKCDCSYLKERPHSQGIPGCHLEKQESASVESDKAVSEFICDKCGQTIGAVHGMSLHICLPKPLPEKQECYLCHRADCPAASKCKPTPEVSLPEKIEELTPAEKTFLMKGYGIAPLISKLNEVIRYLKSQQ